MTQLKIISQNISRSLMGDTRRGGNVAPLRIQVHFEKPSFIIISESCEGEQFTGNNVFQGYTLQQCSRNIDRPRTGGVLVFMKKGTGELIAESVRKSNKGHYTAAVYHINSTKIIIAAVYGPSSHIEDDALEMYTELFQDIRDISQIFGTQMLYIGGDFNINLDKNRPNKPRTVRLVKQFINEFNLLDAGSDSKESTWRRPHLPNSASRIDFSLVSRHFKITQFSIKWGRFDHAQLTTSLTFDRYEGKPSVLKDWSLASAMFQEQAPGLIMDTLLNNDIFYRSASLDERNNFIGGRATNEVELEITVIEPQEGITHMHFIIILLEKLLHLQRKVQNKLKYSRKAALERLSKKLASLYNRIDNCVAGTPEFNEICEQIVEVKNKIKIDADNIEMANRLRITNFYQSSSGKNVAASYYICKESKSGGGG
jgi:hypothetical protein